MLRAKLNEESYDYDDKKSIEDLVQHVQETVRGGKYNLYLSLSSSSDDEPIIKMRKKNETHTTTNAKVEQTQMIRNLFVSKNKRSWLAYFTYDKHRGVDFNR